MSQEKSHEKNIAPKVTFTIEQDIKRDAWNWWDAVNKTSHGVRWVDQLPEQEKNLIEEHCIGKTEDEALVFLIPYLEENYYGPNKEAYEESLTKMQNLFDEKLQKGCDKLVQVMDKPLYRQDYYITLTTYNRGPYDKEKGWMMIGYNWKAPLKSFLHELCHFQFIEYWRENPDSEVSKMSFEDFDFLKESLTMILDENFVNEGIIGSPDQGYFKHKDLRAKLLEKWHETHNFEKLVTFGIEETNSAKQ